MQGTSKSSIDFLTGQCTDLSDKRIEMSTPESVGSHCCVQPEACLMEAQNTLHTDFRVDSQFLSRETDILVSWGWVWHLLRPVWAQDLLRAWSLPALHLTGLHTCPLVNSASLDGS